MLSSDASGNPASQGQAHGVGEERAPRPQAHLVQDKRRRSVASVTHQSLATGASRQAPAGPRCLESWPRGAPRADRRG